MRINTFAFVVDSFRSAIRLVCLAALAILPACSLSPADPTAQPVHIAIIVDGGQQSTDIMSGSTVEDALRQVGIELDSLDQVVPPSYTSLTEQSIIRVTRIRETFEDEERVVPYQLQIIRNETLPEKQERLVQSGENGLEQVTYRQVYQDGVAGPRTVFKVVTLQEAQPEIMMVGVQASYTMVQIPGVLAYITAGNAWVMQGSTSERRPIVTSGDLDGRVFSLSSNGTWLLYSRKTQEDEDDGAINSLWAVNLAAKEPKPISLRVQNVVNFADWVPGPGLSVAYTTVEPRVSAPGWQANNDLHLNTYSQTGIILKKKDVVDTYYGGVYGWWGTSFAWSPDGKQLAYAQTDSIGLVDLEKGEYAPLLKLLPYQTGEDWAWVPGLAWAPGQNMLYTVNHVPLSGAETDESSPLFDVTAIDVNEARASSSVSQSGMFAYPVPSPLFEESRYWVAYLQADYPDKSKTSRYRLVLADPDGSNRQTLFPEEGKPGLDPQRVAWSPAPEGGAPLLAVVYEGNLWLVTPDGGQPQQITGDGSIGKIDWK